MATDFEFDPNNLPGNTPPAASDQQPPPPPPPPAGDTDPPPTGGSTPQNPANDPNNPLNINQRSITNPQLPPGATFTATPQTVGSGEILDVSGAYIPGAPGAGTVQGQVATAKPVEKTAAASYEAFTGGEAAQAEAQQGQVSQEALVQPAQQAELSAELKKTLDDFQSDLDAIGIDPNATVQGQYEKLMNFGPNEIPAWAAGAYRLAEQRLAARGIGGSTMAGEAITTALMQAALPIASQDAQAVQTLNLAKLDKKAQGVFLRAGYIANLDMANLNNRQQAAVVNAQSFLAMDLKNLDNRQQTAIINTQARMQKMLSDQAAINAARQFNASSQQQNDQFFADLGSRIEMHNTAQYNAMVQTNVSEANAQARFNSAQVLDVNKFNSNLSTLIAQSNTNYLRQINTQNTAMTNQQNLVNSQNLLGISNAAMANALQFIRDQAAFSFQAEQNGLDRAQTLALTQMQNAEWYKRFSAQEKNSFWKGVGSFVFGVASDFFEDWDWGSGGSGDENTPVYEGGF